MKFIEACRCEQCLQRHFRVFLMSVSVSILYLTLYGDQDFGLQIDSQDIVLGA